MNRLIAALDLRGRTSRGDYAIAGGVLMALKLALDRIVAHALGGDFWTWLSYWNPLAAFEAEHGSAIPAGAYALLALALPFIGVGVVLTVRRLRDAGWPLWLVVLFFVPALNLIFFALLCLTPARDQTRDPAPPAGVLGWLARILILKNPALSAVVAILFTLVVVTPLSWLATHYFRDYGWGVFVALPFVLGLLAAVIHSAPEPRTWWGCASVGLLALVFCGAAIVAVAIEGVICVAMAAPLAAPVVLLGSTVGYFLQLARWGRILQATRIYSASILGLPLAFAQEHWTPREPRLTAVTTTIEVAAPRAVVWNHVVTFAALPPPREFIFRTGIAYPVRATITGRGVGAMRHCEFSTGPFIEPITAWDAPQRLAFDVIEQPHPMRELSPYRALHPPHLDQFFRSQRGEFRLTPLPEGRTRLEGTTWYTQRLWPEAYWRAWSDYLVHAIHGRVLEHIRHEAEAATASTPLSPNR